VPAARGGRPDRRADARRRYRAACLKIAAHLAASPATRASTISRPRPTRQLGPFRRAIFDMAGSTSRWSISRPPNTRLPAPRPLNSRLDCYHDRSRLRHPAPRLARRGLADILNDLHAKVRHIMTKRKGIILAGGSGTRLYPITMGVSKQLLPIYDKPMIYYPISVLMLAGIREIAIITTPEDQAQFSARWAMGGNGVLQFTYIVQPSPDGLAQAYLLAEDFLDGAPSAMVLGDNIFFGHGLPEMLAAADKSEAGGTVFGYRVADPERYGVVDFDPDGARCARDHRKARGAALALRGDRALFPRRHRAGAAARSSRPPAASWRSRRFWRAICRRIARRAEDGPRLAWLDTGTHASLLDAANFVRTLTERQGMQSGSPEEIAYAQGWINGAHPSCDGSAPAAPKSKPGRDGGCGGRSAVT
jgi:glucose-1-phosphate thymidylyltransferase